MDGWIDAARGSFLDGWMDGWIYEAQGEFLDAGMDACRLLTWLQRRYVRKVEVACVFSHGGRLWG